ncbi:MAG: endonuclease NucS domain-containing protein [Promethearchaeia archaeon]
MELNENEIKKLLEWFVESSNTKKEDTEHRNKSIEKNHKWIQLEVINDMSNDEFKNKFLNFYEKGGGLQNMLLMYKNSLTKDIDKLKKSLLYLLDENIPIKKRCDEVIGQDGDHHIKGLGKGLATAFLISFKPEKYGLWNNKTENGLEVLGWKPHEKGDTKGEKYEEILRSLKDLRDLGSKHDLSLSDIDLFLHTISATEEGGEIVEKIKQGGTIFDPDDPEKSEDMTFMMEKYLEHFMEKNFSRIGFDSNLKLFQDEENNGRQYPTSVGRIDLLAIDKATGDYVVIELKKGDPADKVVGQTLRYMGWVKENLVENDNKDVRGLIILKNMNDRLKYALNNIRNIDVYEYKVDFKIQSIS